MRIGILTFHRAYNCGAVLQAWALKRTLEKMGHEVGVVDCQRVGDVARFQKFEGRHRGFRQLVSVLNYLRIQAISIGPVDYKRHLFRNFCAENLKPVACRVEELPEHFDKLVFGSDQIWNPKLMTEEETALFFGESVPSSLPKITYAASIGDNPLDDAEHERLVCAAKNFEAISVREKLAGEGLLDKQGRSPVEVVDPSLLLTKEDYLVIANPRRMKKGKYILVYALFATPFVCTCAEKASKKLGLPYVILAMYQYGFNNRPQHVISGFGPAEFLAWYRDAEVVLASSFHGTAFAAIFGKPFVSLRNEMDKHESRPAALLNALNEKNRLVNPSTVSVWLEELESLSVDRILDSLECCRETSMAYLRMI